MSPLVIGCSETMAFARSSLMFPSLLSFCFSVKDISYFSDYIKAVLPPVTAAQKQTGDNLSICQIVPGDV